MNLTEEMREFAYWKESRNRIVWRALRKNIPCTSIARQMSLDSSTIYALKAREEEPTRIPEKGMTVFGEMREFASWKEKRDDIISRALCTEASITSIAAQMGLDKNTVWRLRKKLTGK